MPSSLYLRNAIPLPLESEKFGIMKHDGCGFDEIEAQARVSPLWKSWA
jgi:hypothetical protein